MSRILIDALSHAKNKIVTPKKIGKGRVSKNIMEISIIGLSLVVS